MPQHLEHIKDRHKEVFDSQETEKRLLELYSLFELSQTLNSSLDLKSILDNILLVPMGRMLISRGIILFGDGSGKFQVQYFKGLPKNLEGKKLKIAELPAKSIKLSSYKENNEWLQFFRDNKLELIIPVSSKRSFTGIIAYGRKMSGIDYSDDEINFLSSLTNIAVQSIENARSIIELNQINRSLDQKIQELNTLFEIGRELNLLFDSEDILKQLSYALMGQMLTNRIFVTLSSNGSSEIIFKKGFQFSKEEIDSTLALCKKIKKEIDRPVLCRKDGRFKVLLDMGVHAVIPMQIQNEIAGYIFLGPKMNNVPHSEADLEFLSILANMTIIAIENARLIEEKIEKERLEEELSLAKSIQDKLLPAEMPENPGWSIHGINIPSKLVGGDYFDIISLTDDVSILTIADVSGKGMPAALLMSNLQAGLQMLSTEDYSLADITKKLNNLIYRNTTIEKFITFFILKLNLTDGSFSYVNAGHNPPYIFTDGGTVQELEEGGLILGMMPDINYSEGSGNLDPNDCLAMFTDGVTEAMNNNEEFFDEEGVISFFQENHKKMNSADMNNKLISTVLKFSEGSSEVDDDITILTLKRL